MRRSSPFIRKAVNKAVLAIGILVLVSPAFSNVSPDERVIRLKGTTNTRDIGGYETTDHATLRWGQIIRSDNLSKLNARDFQKLEDMGLKTVVDLRSEQEHVQSPTVWKGDSPPQFFHFPIGDAKNEWFTAQRKMMKKNRFTEEQSLEHMVSGYRMIVEEGTASYQELMAVVMDESNWPILIHCTAGKDRSGVGVALIMEAVGVDRDTIMQEYLLTNEVSRIQDKAAFLARQSKSASKGTRFSKGTKPEAWLPIVGVRPEMLENFYTVVDEDYGSMDAYLTELGADREARDELTASLTTHQTELAMVESPPETLATD